MRSVYCAKIRVLSLAQFFEFVIHIKLPNATIDYYPNFIDFDESKRLAELLFNELTWRQDKIAMFGKMVDIPRLQAWYGENELRYTYSKLTLTANLWTSSLLAIKKQVCNFCQVDFNAVLANCYRDQHDSVSWHSDDESELGIKPTIASLSFGAERMFHLKHRYTGETYKLPLQSGSLLIMSGDTQEYWQHAIPKTRIECLKRINLTFRKIN